MEPIHSLYFHFPYCRHKCNYCDFYKEVSFDNDFSLFESELENTLAVHHDFLTEKGYFLNDLATLYFGGGTPSLWKPSGLMIFLDLLKNQKIKLNHDCEFTIEMNPGTITNEEIEVFF